jgi:hypothetical protein
LLNAAEWLKPETKDQVFTQSTCARVQLFGEYLHALQDTFGHRNADNVPIEIGDGIGHGFAGNEPDKTYNENVTFSKFPGAIANWRYREQRTLEMQREVFKRIKEQFPVKILGSTSGVTKFEDIEATLIKFNRTKESEDSKGLLFEDSIKIKLLNATLLNLGFAAIPTYNVNSACVNRKINLKGLGVGFATSYGEVTILRTPGLCPMRREVKTE